MLSDEDLLHTPLADLVALAGSARDEAHGRRVTFSPKVFIPLTMLCRDRCGYCTFAKAPARVDVALPHARRGARDRPGAGRRPGATRRCSPSASDPSCATRWPATWLAAHGYSSTVDYLAAMCRLVVDETGLLPHANAGALSADELAALRPVSASQGMMIESLAAGSAATAARPTRARRGGSPRWRRPAARDPVHHRDPGRHRRDRARPAGRARGDRRVARARTATCRK